VALLVEEEGYPVRRACRYFQLYRSTFQYRLQRPQEKHARLIERLTALSWKHPRYGYRRIVALLRREGWTVSKKQVQRLRRLVGLKVKPPKKRVRRRGVSTGWLERATHRHQVWSWDFIHDRTDNGGPLKMLTLIDEYSRQCLAIRPARALKSEDVLEVVKQAVRDHGAPDYLRSDNGSEFIAHVVQDWFREHGIKTIYIEPGSPWQNGWIESFHARLRDECLNRELLLNLREARVVIEDFRLDYNQNRPHSRLGYLSPNQWIEKQSSSPDFARPAGLAASRLESSENIN
jgi:transposase InsO family protein